MTCVELSRCVRYGDSIDSLGTFSIEVDVVYGASVFFWPALDHSEVKTEGGIASVVTE